MFALLDESQDIKDVKNAMPLRLNGGSVEFQNVSFKYSNE